MKLVFYGGGDEKDNLPINKALLRLAGKRNPLLTYIPASSYDADIEFSYFARHFRKYNVSRIINFPIDVHYSETLLREVLRSDVIYLGGGNTFYFLQHLRKNNLLVLLRDFVERGGVLAGLSAGAIMMTPSIATASFPEFDCDYNEENITNFYSLGLVRFEIFPHYKNSRRYDDELMRYSQTLSYPLYACPDTCGIVVDDDRISFIGKTYCFFQGKKLLLKAA